MSGRPLVAIAALFAVMACSDSAGPTDARVLAGNYVADSLYCWTTFDTGDQIITQGAALTLILRADSSLGGRLTVPATWMPDGLSAVDDTLYGAWRATLAGFRVYGPWGSLLTVADFTVTGGTARASIVVRGFPLDPFRYEIRLQRQ